MKINDKVNLSSDAISNSNQSKEEELNRLFNKYRWYFGMIVVFICFLPFLFTNFFLSDRLAFNNTGQIGDTIGGIMGPFIGILAGAVTFMAFWQQYKANVILQAQLDKQDTQYKKDQVDRENKERLDRFESKYYELLRFHRANLNEMKIGSEIFGRNYFKVVYKEFKMCYEVCHQVSKRFNDNELKEIGCLTTIAYNLFFKGISFVEKESHNKSNFSYYRELKLVISNMQRQFTDFESRYINHRTNGIINIAEEINGKMLNYKIRYYPFKGHISGLAHYYRHLFHTVKFVAKQSEEFLCFERKLEYLQMLRAQLSNHEQTMLYYNAVAGYGEAWFHNEYFTKYKMIHNLPFELADFGVLPHEHKEIKKGIDFWQKRGGQLFEQDE